MRLSSTRSFALFALSLFSSVALSVDSNDAAILKPRLDDGYITSSSAPSPSRRRKKCSSVLPANSPVVAAVSAPSPGPSSGFGSGTNATSLGNALPYSRTSRSKCTRTSTIYAPKPTDQLSPIDSSPGQHADHTHSGDNNVVAPEKSAVDASPARTGSPQAHGNESHSNEDSDPTSPQSAASPSSCAPRSTVTVTNQNTVTVTASPGPAAASDENAALPNSVTNGGPSVYNGAVPNSPAETSPSSRRRKCSSEPKTTGLGTAIAPSSLGTTSASVKPASQGPYSKPPSSSIQLAAVYNVAPTSREKSFAPSRSVSATMSPSNSALPDSNDDYDSKRAAKSNASSIEHDGELWAGATIGTIIRMEHIPERKFYDFDGKTIKDPIKTLGSAGLNAVRIETSRGQCLGPSHFVNNGSTLGEELLFTLDFGCIDTQVQIAQQAIAQGMRIQLTINQGFDIPKEAESYSYEEMIKDIQKETKRQLQPFLDVKIVPDVILLENEGSDGILFTEKSTGHVRGTNDGKASAATVDKELCGQIPTGNMVSYPQMTGYYKAEIIACNEAIAAAGFKIDNVRYGLHSHGQYVQWKEGVVHGVSPPSESVLLNAAGNKCPGGQVIPADILAKNASEMLTIAGFSAYPDPMRPTDINSTASMEATLDRLKKTLTQIQADAERYGKYDSGPFKGQYKLQSLGVEYGTSYAPDEVDAQIAHTQLMWSAVKRFPSFLGMLWYEAWYCHGDWEGGQAALCYNIDKEGISGQAPKKTMKTWGSNAVSPWKT